MSSRLLRFILLIAAMVVYPLSVFATNVAGSDGVPEVAPWPLALPPTPDVIPGSLSASGPLDGQDEIGAFIQLNLAHASRFIGATVVVQWQNNRQQWLDVPGWHSMLGAKAIKWWVSPQDFGAGPFRWIIVHKQVLVVQSKSFVLPEEAGVTLTIRAS